MKTRLIILLFTILLHQGCIIDDSVDHVMDIISTECDSAETERDSSCLAITKTIHAKMSSCDIPVDVPVDVCELDCIDKDHKDGYYCFETHAVNVCIDAIYAMPCNDVHSDIIRTIIECRDLFIYMEDDCVDFREWEDDIEDGTNDHFDDDDWD